MFLKAPDCLYNLNKMLNLEIMPLTDTQNCVVAYTLRIKYDDDFFPVPIYTAKTQQEARAILQVIAWEITRNTKVIDLSFIVNELKKQGKLSCE